MYTHTHTHTHTTTVFYFLQNEHHKNYEILRSAKLVYVD